MPSSIVGRKGRWFWSCAAENNSTHWKDHWACRACSRLTYSTKEEAEKAGRAHAYKTGHDLAVQQIGPRLKREYATR